MNQDTAIRAWIGWRASHLAHDDQGWNTFVRDLKVTFIPATWLVMTRHGLRAYVPTVLRQDRPAHIPDEIALLLYESADAYQAHKDTVAGRSYSVMHRALFEFDVAERRSRSNWASAAPEANKLQAFRRAASGQGLAFDSPGAQAIVVVLDGPAGRAASAQAVFDALGYPDHEAAAVCEQGLTVAWLAAPEGTALAAVAEGLRSALGLPADAVVAAHAAAAAELPFTDPDQKHPSAQFPELRVAPDQSLHFRRGA